MKSNSLLLEKIASERSLFLKPEHLRAFDLLSVELLSWNRRINLTSITNSQDIVIKHYLDSLTLVALLRGDETLLDIGSGAGFPVLPLKIVLPDLEAVSLDATQKKIHFQRHIIRLLGLTGIVAVHDRVENLVGTYAGRFEIIVSRAFAGLADLIRVALPLLAQSGRIVAMKGKEGRAEAEATDFSVLGVRLVDLIELELPEEAGWRTLLVLEKEICS